MGATSLYVFGSTARDEAKPGSDLDVFIDYDPAGQVQCLRPRRHQTVARGQHLAIPVDLTTRDGLASDAAAGHRAARPSGYFDDAENRPRSRGHSPRRSIGSRAGEPAGKLLQDFDASSGKPVGWLQRGIEIISEASPPRVQEYAGRKSRDAGWLGIGNVLRSCNMTVLSNRIIWGVVVNELPRLKAAIAAIMESLRE